MFGAMSFPLFHICFFYLYLQIGSLIYVFSSFYYYLFLKCFLSRGMAYYSSCDIEFGEGEVKGCGGNVQSEEGSGISELELHNGVHRHHICGYS